MSHPPVFQHLSVNNLYSLFKSHPFDLLNHHAWRVECHNRFPLYFSDKPGGCSLGTLLGFEPPKLVYTQTNIKHVLIIAGPRSFQHILIINLCFHKRLAYLRAYVSLFLLAHITHLCRWCSYIINGDCPAFLVTFSPLVVSVSPEKCITVKWWYKSSKMKKNGWAVFCHDIILQIIQVIA